MTCHLGDKCPNRHVHKPAGALTSEEEQKPLKKKINVFLRCQPSHEQVQFVEDSDSTNIPLTAFTREEDIHPIFSSVTPTSHSVTVSLGP